MSEKVCKISVTQECIDDGRVWDDTCCPIALAIQGVTLADIPVSVGMMKICIGTEVISTPKDAARFIDKFDLSAPVEPFVFEIEIPEEFLAENYQPAA